MPFRRSCRVTATNEGTRPVDAFYYYIDYRELERARPAERRTSTPSTGRSSRPTAARNYLLLAAEGAGHYVGCNLSVLQRAMGWWGEGDDMITVDGEMAARRFTARAPRTISPTPGACAKAESPFYGCPLQEEDFQAGSKATVYRFHVPDPVPFKKSIQVTIEHGHANDRQRSSLLGRLLVPDRAPPALPAARPGRRAASLRLRAAGEFRPAAMGRGEAAARPAPSSTAPPGSG